MIKQLNMLEVMLKHYKRCNGITTKDISNEIGIARETATAKLGQDADDWKIGELKAFCKVIKMPLSKAFDIVLQMEKEMPPSDATTQEQKE